MERKQVTHYNKTYMEALFSVFCVLETRDGNLTGGTLGYRQITGADTGPPGKNPVLTGKGPRLSL